MESPRKKILYVITKSNFGGAQRYVYELATAMQERYDVVVACGGDGPLAKKLVAAGIPVRTIKSFARDINIKKELSSFFELWKIYREEQPDIVHLNSSKAGGIGALLARICRVPLIVFTAHGWPFFEERNLIGRVLIWALSYTTVLLSHRTIVVSEHDLANAHMPFLKEKLKKIHTAIPDIAFLDRSSARKILFSEEVCLQHANDWWAISTGELTPNKNLRALLEALTIYNVSSEKRIFLTLIGDGEERAILEKYVQDHGLRNYVQFTGYVDNARTYLKAFDLFLLPSKKEGMPYGLLEACAAELPIITSNVGGIPEIITHEKSGLLVPSGDIYAIAHAMTQILGGELYRRTLAAGAYGRVDDFSLEKMLRETVAVYDSTNSRAT